MSIETGKLMNLGDGKILYDDLRSRIDGKDVTAPIAQSDTATATEAHAVGDVISVGGQLYVVTAAIAIGDTIAEGTNVESTTVMAQMAAKMAACLTSSTFAEYFIENIMGIECRTAGSSFEFNASHKIAHERGTVYICEYIGAIAYTIYGSQSFPTVSDSNFNVYTIWGYIQAKFDNLDNLKAPIDAPAFTGYLRLATTNATGYGAISAGEGTSAYGRCSSAFGTGTATEMINSHVTGRYNIIEQIQSRSSRKTYKVGDIVKESTGNYYKCKQGYTSPNNNTWLPSEDTTHWAPWAGYAEVVGNGTGPESSNRSNARTMDFSGNEEIAGTFKCQTSVTIGSTTITEAQLQALLATLE